MALCAPLKRRLRLLDLSHTAVGWSATKWWLLLRYSPHLAHLHVHHTSGSHVHYCHCCCNVGTSRELVLLQRMHESCTL
jgi:hypothetical protein